MNTYYDKLMEINGADELKELVKRWEILSCNLSKRTFDVPVFLPDLFMYTRPGYGNTKLISLIAEYLDSKQNLMSFYGDVKFFEFKLEYCSPGSNFSELYRLMESIQTAAGFRNEYKGVIRINVDDWVGHHKEKHFLDFLQFLQINTSHWFVILTISNKSENVSRALCPIAKTNWVYKRWFSPDAVINDDTYILKTNYKDNRFLPTEYIQSLL